MDIERGCIEILFKRMPYDSLSFPTLENKPSLENITKDLFMKYANIQFQYYSNNEIANIYDSLSQYFKKKLGRNNIFDYLVTISSTFLNYTELEPTCKYEQLLRWRETSFILGQDLFTTSLLAKQDIIHEVERTYFSWRPILRTDNNRLQNILNQGLAENHFHINGSSQSFMLNWISIMNNVVRKDSEKNIIFDRLTALQSVDCTPHKINSIYDKVRLAAYYRCYLFVCSKNDVLLMNKMKDWKFEDSMDIELYATQLQKVIDICRETYGYEVYTTQQMVNDEIRGDSKVLDYCLTRELGAYNDNHNRILAGERHFLYTCFRRIFSDKLENKIENYKQKLFFWRYLTIKSEFRSELIQVNGSVGFDNFNRYQKRKALFIKKNYLKQEFLKLAVSSTCIDQNIKSLEGRLMYDGVKIMRKELRKLTDDTMSKDAELFLVVHFPKMSSRNNCMPKNSKCRKESGNIARRLYQLLEEEKKQQFIKNPLIKIKGIDACSNEIGCRPEVFAQAFRFLLAEARITRETSKKSLDVCYVANIELKATYHAGEDFLDICDGLRAIDEVLLFCGYRRDFRIGHALALGIRADEYYAFKHYKVIMPKQDALDNIVWIMERSIELGIDMDMVLKGELMQLYSSWISDIYDWKGNVDKQHQEITSCEYYNAWKLRGDNPEIYCQSDKDFLEYLHIEELDLYKRYNLNNAVDNSVRRKHRHRQLYFRYHFDEHVQIRGNEIVTMDISQSYIEHITKLQDAMIHLLVKKGIGIECNPSSNFLIGTINKYNEHPILRFQPIKQDKNYPGKLSASINTDDQGVFDTYLENEYALMAYALQKEYEKGRDAVYDVEDIYEWIDHIRKLGIQQKF